MASLRLRLVIISLIGLLTVSVGSFTPACQVCHDIATTSGRRLHRRKDVKTHVQPPGQRSLEPFPGLLYSSPRSENFSSDPSNNDSNTTINWPTVLFLGTISSLYWYWMVLAAAAVANDWLGSALVPDFVPLVPGWPPSDQDLQPVIEDSFHFFYLSELLHNQDAPEVNPIRLAAFNIDEAWIFAYLIALWRDPKRLPRPILLISWLALGINLTNAFLAPYLLVTEFNRGTNNENNDAGAPNPGKNPIVAALFGAITIMVVTYALSQTLSAGPEAWHEFGSLVARDRTYLAFCVDLPLFSIFQPILLSRVKGKSDLQTIDYVPILGLVAWLFSKEN
jgi:hypothetical protein